MDLKQLIFHARKAGVDEHLLNYMSRYRDIADFRKHEEPARQAYIVFVYVDKVIKKRWQPGEPCLLQNVHYTFNYIIRYLPKGTRWLAGEQVLLTDIDYAYAYVSQWLKHPWNELEPKLKHYPGYCALYAIHILKKRWSSVEPIIREDSYWWEIYARHFFLSK